MTTLTHCRLTFVKLLLLGQKNIILLSLKPNQTFRSKTCSSIWWKETYSDLSKIQNMFLLGYMGFLPLNPLRHNLFLLSAIYPPHHCDKKLYLSFFLVFPLRLRHEWHTEEEEEERLRKWNLSIASPDRSHNRHLLEAAVKVNSHMSLRIEAMGLHTPPTRFYRPVPN